jgi:MFS family permease
VGFHETLIAIAPIVGPLTVAFAGMQGKAVFGISAAFALVAFVPLAWARKPVAEVTTGPMDLAAGLRAALAHTVFRQGVWIALLGGMLEAAVSGLFAVYTQNRSITALQTADLLAVFGVGGLLLQYPVGWLADRMGLRATTMACAIGTLLVSVVMTMPLDHPVLMAAVFMLGGFITAFLTLAIIASTLTGGSMAANVSLISMFYTLSAVAGPLAAGALISVTNGNALMWFAAALAALMALAMLNAV